LRRTDRLKQSRRCSGRAKGKNYSIVEFTAKSAAKLEGTATYSQGCSGAGTRENGVPTPVSRFALK